MDFAVNCVGKLDRTGILFRVPAAELIDRQAAMIPGSKMRRVFICCLASAIIVGGYRVNWMEVIFLLAFAPIVWPASSLGAVSILLSSTLGGTELPPAMPQLSRRHLPLQLVTVRMPA